MKKKPGNMIDSRDYEIKTIVSAQDPLWKEWFEIYVGSFPLCERMSEVFFDDLFAKFADQESVDANLIAMLGKESGKVVGIAFTESDLEAGVGFLWYIATHPDFRDAGLGTALFREAIDLMKGEEPALKFVLIEVEDPKLAKGADVEIAHRRIGWYRRLGCQILSGIRYMQTVDSVDTKTEMALMVYQLLPLQWTPEEVFIHGKNSLGPGALEQIGALSFC